MPPPRLNCAVAVPLLLLALATAAAAAPAGGGGAHNESQAPASMSHAESGRVATDALFFFAVALLIGVFTVHVLNFTRVPYTALLLVGEGGEGGGSRGAYSSRRSHLPPLSL